jgi:hypothetical protein
VRLGRAPGRASKLVAGGGRRLQPQATAWIQVLGGQSPGGVHERCASVHGRWMRSARSGEVRCRRAAGAGGAWLAVRRRGVVGSASAARTERRGALRGAAAVVAWRLDQERGEHAQDGGRPVLVRGSGADEARAGAGDAARAFTAAGARSVCGRREGARERARARG